MDVQSVTKTQKTSLFGNFGAQAENATAAGDAPGAAESAFSSLLNLVGVKFNTGSALGGMESKLMHSNDAAHAAQAENRQEEDNNAPRSLTKAKGTKADDKDTKSAKDDTKTDTAAKSDDTSNTDQTAAADQAQTAVQATVTAAVEIPVAAETQAAPVVAAVQKTAVAETAAATETTATVAAVTAQTQVQAAVEVAQPAQVEKAAELVQQTAGPVVAQAKAVEKGPQLMQAAAAVATTDDTTADADTAVQTVTAVAAKTAAVKETGPKETRSAAAVDQSQAMSRDLGDDTKIQVKVQVTGKVAANQAFNDASPYNIYTGYTAAAESSTANGQVGQSNATNALVQAAAKPEIQAQMQAQAAPIILPPQLQSQQALPPAPTPMASADAAPIQALEGSSGAQNNASNGGFASVGGQAQNTPATQNTGASKQAATDQPQVTSREIVDQIKVVISRATKSGLDKVQIQLKPAELGRIDVKLEMSEDHKVSVTVTADNKETLALLQNDSHTLEKTLNDAGLRTNSSNLHFNLRSDSDPREAQNGQSQGRGQGNANTGDAAADAADPAYDYAAVAQSRGGVDTFA